MTTLANYETDVEDLLHDPSQQYWATAQIDRYINQARTKLVMDTGCLRTLQTIYTTASQEAITFGQVTGASITAGGTGYTNPTAVFTGGGGGTGVAATLGVTGGAVTSITFTNFGSGYTSAPTCTVTDGGGANGTIVCGVINVNTYDVLGINLIWGASRMALQWRPWSMFSALMRPYVGLISQPAMWAVYGDTQVYLGPMPDQTYPAEVDSVILPTDLSGATVDPIPLVSQGPIKYYAAHLAKFNSQSFGEAEIFLEQYNKKLQDVVGAYTRRIPNIYEDAK